MAQVPQVDAVSTLKPYAQRFAKIYAIVAGLALLGWLVLSAWIMPNLVFDWFMGPLTVVSLARIVVTSTTVAGAAVAIFFAGIAYERYW